MAFNHTVTYSLLPNEQPAYTWRKFDRTWKLDLRAEKNKYGILLEDVAPAACCNFDRQHCMQKSLSGTLARQLCFIFKGTARVNIPSSWHHSLRKLLPRLHHPVYASSCASGSGGQRVSSRCSTLLLFLEMMRVKVGSSSSRVKSVRVSPSLVVAFMAAFIRDDSFSAILHLQTQETLIFTASSFRTMLHDLPSYQKTLISSSFQVVDPRIIAQNCFV